MARMSVRALGFLAGVILAAGAAVLVAVWMFAGREEDTSAGRKEDTPKFCFPALEQSGRLTSAPWTGRPSRLYRVRGNHYLAKDLGNSQLYLWNAKERKLTELGNGYLMAVPGLGNVICRSVKGDGTDTICELDLENERFRVLWQEHSGIGILGQSNGRLVLRTEGKLVILAPGQAPVVRDMKWDASFVTAGQSVDLVKGTRILMHGPPWLQKKTGAPFEVEVGILDIETGKLRRIGKVPGYWAQLPSIGAMYDEGLYPHVSISWVSASKAKELESTAGGKTESSIRFSYVVEETEQLLTVPASTVFPRSP